MTDPLIPERLQAGRLRYERLGLEHGAELEALMGDPQVRPTLWPWPEPPSSEQLGEILERQAGYWERLGYGPWMLYDAVTGEFVGRGGLQWADELGAAEAIWAIVSPRWGEGLATELALTSVRVGFEGLGLPELIAFTLPGNLASRRVMEKAGFAYARDVQHAGLPHVLYRCHRGRGVAETRDRGVGPEHMAGPTPRSRRSQRSAKPPAERGRPNRG